VQWNDLWAACALYLVLEGLMPFLNPGGMKGLLGRLAELPEAVLRVAGLASMIVGAVLLYLVRGGSA
jgi:uncharacterized protein YjeT (DUF2065 family)